MKNLLILLTLALSLLFSGVKAQEEKDSIILSMEFNPFSRTDTNGIKFLHFLNQFEKYGHFNYDGQKIASKEFLANYKDLFDPNASVPHDLQSEKKIPGTLSIDAYTRMALDSGYTKYAIVFEQKTIKVSRTDTNKKFKARMRYLKIFNNRPVSGKPYKHAAIYYIDFEFDELFKDISITNIHYNPEEEFFEFQLGNIAHVANSEIAMANRLESLIKEIVITDPIRMRTEILFYGGYVMIDHLTPEPFYNNYNTQYTKNTEQSGWSAGIQLRIPLDNKGKLRLLLGLEYERNVYALEYNDLHFIYTTDCEGYPLIDLEGTEYDNKYVEVSSFTDEGYIGYLRPEGGIQYQIGLGKLLQFNMHGLVGFSYPLVSSFTTNSVVSYWGEKEGQGPPIQGDHLGFYSDYPREYTATFAEAKPFLNYKVGFSFDINFSEKTALVLGAEYKRSITNAFGIHGNQCHFLDPEEDRFWETRFNNLTQNINYNGVAFTCGIKFTFKDKDRSTLIKW